MDLRIEGGRVLAGGRLEATSVHFTDEDGGRISALGSEAAASRTFDAAGALVLPGIVDIHGDAFERQIMPRPGVSFPIGMALIDSDRQAVANRGTGWPVSGCPLRTTCLPTGTVMARTRETMAEPGAKTGVTRTCASPGTPVTVSDPCLATVAPVASRSVSVTLAPPCTMSTVTRAVTAWSGDDTGAAASFVATGTGRVDAARGGGYLAATKDPLGTSSRSGVP